MNPRPIVVVGDRYSAMFYVSDSTVKDVSGDCAIVMPVGADYICEAIKGILQPQSVTTGEQPELKIGRPLYNHRFINEKDNVRVRYTMGNIGEVLALEKEERHRKQPVLITATESRPLRVWGVKLSCVPAMVPAHPYNDTDTKNSVLVHWIGGELVDSSERLRPDSNDGKPSECEIHVQIGLSDELPRKKPAKERAVFLKPEDLAKPTQGRIVVVNIGEISETHRIRKSQSYEAIAVDLLRYLRGDSAHPNPELVDGVLNHLSMFGEKAAPWSILAVRLNNSAVFLYICKGKKLEDFKERALIVCHKLQCAPMEAPELGKMLGYTGFVSSHFASAARTMDAAPDLGRLADQAVESVKSSLAWQRAAYDRGCLTMLFEYREDEAQTAKVGKKKAKKWQPTPAGGYGRLFNEIREELDDVKARSPGIKSANDHVISIPVDISRAVAHRTPWFMARSAPGVVSPENKDIEESFRKEAITWLCDEKASDEKKPEKGNIPIVSICDLKLTDRREVEDFLAIHQAMVIYSKSAQDAKPLNIGVFGAPRAGKSFGVIEVVKYIERTSPGVFLQGDLQFNLGQFKALGDLPAALHLVRNACLTGKIPIVFFDEFDSAFDGQAFGWLKYLLAPMQDGNFYDNGATYKIGNAVFIFAGGVNRSFEELNGRMRNPGFCEAKGPDFISRLKAHLNIQGVNKPMDDGDQGRYILRRGILLHGIVRRRLELKKEQKPQPLLDVSVARALLSLDRFKHGVRSLESIIKMCTVRPGHPIGPSDLPSMEQMEMHVDASKLLREVDKCPE